MCSIVNLCAGTSMSYEDDLLFEAARLYYEEDYTQADIGRRLNTSRSTVSRLLRDARERGLVQITIVYPWDRDYELEDELCRRFELRDSRVLKGNDRSIDDRREGMGRLAAAMLTSLVKDGDTVAVSYGRTVASTVNAMHLTPRKNVTVVQLIGALGADNPLVDGPDIVRQLGSVFGADYRYLNAPLLVEDTHTRNLLVQEPSIRETLALSARADVVLLGIGSLGEDVPSLIWAGQMSDQELAWLRGAGSVGHMCAQHYDRNGKILQIDVNRRVIGQDLVTLHNIKTVLAVAGGKKKAVAILGALRGRNMNVLVTDDRAASEVLRLDDERSRE